jgi:hypothetical protein
MKIAIIILQTIFLKISNQPTQTIYTHQLAINTFLLNYYNSSINSFALVVAIQTSIAMTAASSNVASSISTIEFSLNLTTDYTWEDST